MSMYKLLIGGGVLITSIIVWSIVFIAAAHLTGNFEKRYRCQPPGMIERRQFFYGMPSLVGWTATNTPCTAAGQ